MDTPSSSTRDFARRLLATSQTASGPHVHEAVVIETLRTSLTKFAGSDGFTSLLRRALVLARAEVPALQSVNVGADGRLEGLEPLATDTGIDAAAGEAAVAVTVHLLGLLVTFIGKPFTLRLLREAWPDTSLDDTISTIEAG